MCGGPSMGSFSIIVEEGGGVRGEEGGDVGR